MRFLGIDYGSKRIGLALSDEGGTMAFPKNIIPNDSDTLNEIAEIINSEKVQAIVVGESMDFSGQANAISSKIEDFVQNINDKFGLPVHKQKEFLTTVEARKSPDAKAMSNKSQAHTKNKAKKGDSVDAGAAALILQRFLDRKAVKEKI